MFSFAWLCSTSLCFAYPGPGLMASPKWPDLGPPESICHHQSGVMIRIVPLLPVHSMSSCSSMWTCSLCSKHQNKRAGSGWWKLTPPLSAAAFFVCWQLVGPLSAMVGSLSAAVGSVSAAPPFVLFAGGEAGSPPPTSSAFCWLPRH